MKVAQVWNLVKATFSSWLEDYAPSMGAALAYYTMFSIAPLLLIVISTAGLVFGEEAVRGEIFGQLRGLMGDEGARAVQSLLESVSSPEEGKAGTIVGTVLLLIGATTVLSELQDAFDRIWRVPERDKNGGVWAVVRSRLLSFGMILGIGFLMMVSLVFSAAMAALGKWWGPLFSNLEIMASVVNFAFSFALATTVFAILYKYHAPRENPLAGCLGRSGRHRALVRHRQVPYRSLYWEECHQLGIWRRRFVGGGAGLGLLLRADLFARGGIYAGLFPGARLAEEAATAGGSRGAARRLT